MATSGGHTTMVIGHFDLDLLFTVTLVVKHVVCDETER